jgi:hypothetical protein
MNTSDSSNSSPFNFDFLAPQPSQDTDLLQQLYFVPGLKEFLLLRQVHALEHATVWVLGENKKPYSPPGTTTKMPLDDELLGGLSTEQGFFLYGDVDISNLRRAVTLAKHRLTSGEWDLAVHPRCGTNVSVAMLLTAGLAVTVPFILPFRPIEQLIGLGLAATAAAEIAPDLGMLTQRYLTTSIPFNLAIEHITIARDFWGKESHFVKVFWQD